MTLVPVPAKRQLEEVKPGAVLLPEEIVLEKFTKENAGLFAPVLVLPERLSITTVVAGCTFTLTFKMPLYSWLVSQAN